MTISVYSRVNRCGKSDAGMSIPHAIRGIVRQSRWMAHTLSLPHGPLRSSAYRLPWHVEECCSAPRKSHLHTATDGESACSCTSLFTRLQAQEAKKQKA